MASDEGCRMVSGDGCTSPLVAGDNSTNENSSESVDGRGGLVSDGVHDPLFPHSEAVFAT